MLRLTQLRTVFIRRNREFNGTVFAPGFSLATLSLTGWPLTPLTLEISHDHLDFSTSEGSHFYRRGFFIFLRVFPYI